uniref:hypothetical protein n=1 Tax=Anaerococcus mediterraneensis TaxID=1870984 RepID=UPI00092FFCBA|nr:hypothetical protein [Anaerococcus mediterraneensis]
MQKFYEIPRPRLKNMTSMPIGYYFSDYEETYHGRLVLITGRLRSLHLDLSDEDLWLVCFGGMRLDLFEVKRQGLRVEIVGKVRDLEVIRKEIKEDKEKGIFR